MAARGNEASEAPADEAGLPPELAFLPATVLPRDLLRQVAARAVDEGVTADRALLAAGHLSADRYYRLLAAHVGRPFAERPLRPARQAVVAHVLRAGEMPLAQNAHGWGMLAAPSGAPLRALLAHGARLAQDAAITTPDRLEALIRYEHRDAVSRQASHGLPDWNEALSARGGLTAMQRGVLAAVIVAVCATAWLAPMSCLAALSSVFYVGFLANALLRLRAAAAKPPLHGFAGPRLPDHAMPTYTVVVPLFREAREVRRLAAALDRLDYPRAKLDIILLIEANDRATLRALDRLALPSCYRVVMAPPGHPQTKPRALNVALQFARGRFLVVYDAEDEPEPDQLRAALDGFARDPNLACLQAHLAIDNCRDSWLTRLFTLEYAALFHVVNPGLAALGLPIPLGGTSNHFRVDVLRRLSGWDAWNVTEDIDLGIRLARFGHRVGALASTTFEEAPQRYRAWLTQRRRWQKGWIVTFLTHSRHPLRCWRELGLRGGGAVSAMLFGALASSLLGPFCVAHLAVQAWSGLLLHPQSVVDLVWNVMSVVLVTVGALSTVWPMWRGLERRRLRSLFPWVAAMPVYFVLLSVAAWQALFELAWRPYFWAKTEHGLAKRRFGVARVRAAVAAE